MICPEVDAMLKELKGHFSSISCPCEVWLACVLATLSFSALSAQIQNPPVRVIAFGAHPDDCDLGAGGIAAKYAALGDKVKFVSLTNGAVGHQSQHGKELAQRRRAEAVEAGRRIGIEHEVLDNHDGKLLPTLEVREKVIREIRQWRADIVIAPRPNDYHPDHRYTGVLVQDASYMVIAPSLVTDTPPLTRNPVFLYYSDRFTRPQAFRADIVVSIDDVFEKKINMLDAHLSQFYEWLGVDYGRIGTGAEGSHAAKEVARGAADGRENTATGVAGGVGEVLWCASRPPLSTRKLLRSRNTDFSPKRKRFAGYSRSFPRRRHDLELRGAYR